MASPTLWVHRQFESTTTDFCSVAQPFVLVHFCTVSCGCFSVLSVPTCCASADERSTRKEIAERA